jgi:hypothetical protein
MVVKNQVNLENLKFTNLKNNITINNLYVYIWIITINI